MTDQKWSALAKKVEPGWGPERDRSARIGLEHRASRRRTAMRALAGIATLALVCGGIETFVRLRAHAPTDTAALAPSSTAVAAAVETLTVTRLSPETVLEPMPDHQGRGFVLRSGGARFTAPHDAEHPFVVVAGDVVVEDVGTTFTVQYLASDKLEVAVEQGRVKVRAQGAETEIAAGGRLEFAVLPVSAEKPSSAPTGPAVSPWRPLAERGQFAEAHAALKKAGPNAVRDETADLLLAADVARLGGYPSEALPYLERVVRSHARDPRAGLASFTLGRVLLDELGRPGEAADAFARARVAGGPLAEDALAREVEAASRAGDITKSRDLAREYQSLYPNGRRAKAVAKFGGLD
ncbi:MAG TPA: FecR domain-containing protein [Polyangiaceae bacterium]